ncbi:MAG: cytochrome d ubiquinol oxidase subunit II [bacterium]
MSGFFASIGLPEIVAGVMVLALNAYVLTGGADFGGGVWDLLARGPRRDDQRELIAGAIGPIWEANHVWLILVLVILFSSFPDAFATLVIVLHIPLSLMLVGIVLRGSSFVFRSYGSRAEGPQRRWSRVFAVTSIITPVLLGVIVGAIASGTVGEAATMLPSFGSAPTRMTAPYYLIFVAPWLAPFPLALGALALAMFAFLAAVYLGMAARDDAMRDLFRKRALATAAVVFITAFVSLVLAFDGAPTVGRGLMLLEGSLLLQATTGAAAIIAIWALVTRRWRVARIAAAAQVSLILWGWVLVQYPLIVPPTHTLRSAAAPDITLELVLWGCAGGSVLLLPSLAYLYRTFGRQAE